MDMTRVTFLDELLPERVLPLADGHVVPVEHGLDGVAAVSPDLSLERRQQGQHHVHTECLLLPVWDNICVPLCVFVIYQEF